MSRSPTTPRIALLLIVLGCQCAAHGAEDELFKAFTTPPAEAKPFVRWWWNGGRVTEEEIRREIAVMHEAGIGGFEINTIAQPPHSAGAEKSRELSWLSPEWCKMVVVATEEAHQRGMIADIIVGSGWPFGARFLRQDQMTQKVQSKSIPVQGPKRQTWNREQLLRGTGRSHDGRGWASAPVPELLHVFLTPDPVNSIVDSRNLTAEISDQGTLAVDIPPGKHKLHVVVRSRGFSSVVHGARGADGPVLDHYNASSLQAYLDRMSDALNPRFGGRFGNGIRAVFCDSIELSSANWTDDLADEFKARRGYELPRWLPYVVDFNKDPESYGQLADNIRRVRYDYCKTLVELFHERFVRTYHDWCHEHGALSRYQAYGSPYLMGMLEGFMIPDIPESNNWLYSNSDPYRHGFDVWSKYASSGAHLAGRRIVSTEAMTNTRGLFKTTLQTIKAADDRNFIMGINHSVLHGFNYSPPAAGFPGWVRYGAYFSEQNPWWPYLKLWTQYNARLSAVFQASKPVVRIAVMAPRAETWSKHGLDRAPYQTQPWYAQRLWEPISRCGATADYITETILQKATFKEGKLLLQDVRYDTLVLAGVEVLESESAQALQHYAEQGGRIAYIEKRPRRSPGFLNAKVNDERVKESIDRTVRAGQALTIEIGPAQQDPDKFNTWAGDLMDQLQVNRSIEFKKPHQDVYQVHRRCEDRDIFFICNRGAEPRPLSCKLDTALPCLWLWNPETGSRQRFDHDEEKRIDTLLQPYESLLIVADKRDGAHFKRNAPSPEGAPLPGPWNVTFTPTAGTPFSRRDFKLCDLGTSKDPGLDQFAGTIDYRTELTLVEPRQTAWIDLGTVHGVSEVSCNGKLLGTRWYGRHAYEVGDALRKGKNTLSIKVTTTLFNYAASLKQNAAAQRWTRGRNHKEPSGLLGPVTLRECSDMGFRTE